MTPRGPRILRGALVTMDPVTQQPSLVAFQYNPSSLKRRLEPQLVGGDEYDRSQAVRFMGAPVQTIDVEVEIDATDALEQNDPVALKYGIQPQLAALELLVYPRLTDIQNRQSLLNSGILEVAPLTAPETLFVWGVRRVVPVRLQSYSVTEEAFDSQLNPIRATVALDMRVLNYSDLSVTNDGYHQFVAYQQQLEAIQPLALATNPASVTGVEFR